MVQVPENMVIGPVLLNSSNPQDSSDDNPKSVGTASVLTAGDSSGFRCSKSWYRRASRSHSAATAGCVRGSGRSGIPWRIKSLFLALSASKPFGGGGKIRTPFDFEVF